MLQMPFIKVACKKCVFAHFSNQILRDAENASDAFDEETSTIYLYCKWREEKDWFGSCCRILCAHMRLKPIAM